MSPVALRTLMRKMSSTRARSDCLALHVHLPGPAEQIEIVDVSAAEHGLHGVEEIRHDNAERLQLFAIDVQVELRRAGRIGREDALQRRILVGGEDETAGDCRDVGRRRRRQGSRSWYSKPLPVPRPMIGGRL